MTIPLEDYRCRNCNLWPKCKGDSNPATGKLREEDDVACFPILKNFIPPSVPATPPYVTTFDPVLLSMPNWYDRRQEILETLSGEEQKVALEALRQENYKWYREHPLRWSYR